MLLVVKLELLRMVYILFSLCKFENITVRELF